MRLTPRERDQPTTHRRTSDDTNSPLAPVATRSVVVAERAVPRGSLVVAVLSG